MFRFGLPETLLLRAARGTSDNAGRYANYLFGAINQLPVALATPSLFTIYKQPPRFNNALVLGISQSGKSPDIVSVLAEARRQGALTAAITNVPDSDLAAEADHLLTLHAGEERSIAATKTYTSELMALALLSATLAADAQMLNEITQVPAVIEKVLTVNEHVHAIVNTYTVKAAAPVSCITTDAAVQGGIPRCRHRLRAERRCEPADSVAALDVRPSVEAKEAHLRAGERQFQGVALQLNMQLVGRQLTLLLWSVALKVVSNLAFAPDLVAHLHLHRPTHGMLH